MAFQIKYVRLFECRIWHGYYLHQGNRQNFFNLDINTPADLKTIENILSRYNLKNVFDIQPLNETRRIMAGQKMKVAHDSNGFFVGVSARPTSDPLFYEPTIPFDDQMSLQFGLRLRNPAFYAQITNERMRTNTPAIYYFTNLLPSQVEYADDSGLTTISRQFPDYQERSYEMGEMILDETTNNLYRSFEADNAGIGLTDTLVWEAENSISPLPNNDFINRHEVNDNDRLLLPTQFDYTFTPLESVTISSVDVILQDLTGAVLQSENFSVEPGQTQIPLNYQEIGTGWYQLFVSTPSGDYSTEQFIYLNDELYDQSLWGVIELGHNAALSASSSNRRLLEADGSLRHTTTEPETPVFNLRIPNRYTYWRYKPHPTQLSTLNPDTTMPNISAAVFEGDLLVTSQHLPNTQFGVEVEYIDQSGGTAMLPSPVVNICVPDADGRHYSDVHLGLIPI